MAKNSEQKTESTEKKTAQKSGVVAHYAEYKKNFNYAKSAVVATILAVVFLGTSFAFFGLWQGAKSDVATLKAQSNTLRAQSNSVKFNHDRVADTNKRQNYVVKFRAVADKTALEQLKAKHSVVTKSYSYGEMVTGIDGVVPDSAHFWAFLVNGKMASEGAGTYKTKAGDKVEFRLEKIDE